jgi:hypothetical protein
MPGASERSAILLADIAILLGTTPEAFRQPAVLDAMRQEYVDVIAACLATDPQFRRIAQAFLDVGDPAGRRAIADSVEAIAGAFAMQSALRRDD